MQIQPYLYFDGRCEEAIEFYRQALDAKIEVMLRYKEMAEPMPPEMVPTGYEDRVMHASFRIGDSVVMASDGCSGSEKTFQGFQLSVSVADSGEAERRFAALANGGQVKMPLGRTFFSPSFGTLVDRFGVSWMVIVPAAN